MPIYLDSNILIYAVENPAVLGPKAQARLYLLRLGYSHAFRGATHVRAGHPAAAAADLRHAVELWANYKAPDSEDQFERARALALLAGLGTDAKSGVSAAEATAFANQAVTALRDAIAAGFAQRAELDEPDFDAVRQRDDFRDLVKELAGRPKP